jgi:hypothetical protein
MLKPPSGFAGQAAQSFPSRPHTHANLQNGWQNSMWQPGRVWRCCLKVYIIKKSGAGNLKS